MSLSIFSIPCFIPVKLSASLYPTLFLTFYSKVIIPVKSYLNDFIVTSTFTSLISGFLGVEVSFLGSRISTFSTVLSGLLPRTRLSNNFDLLFLFTQVRYLKECLEYYITPSSLVNFANSLSLLAI